MNFLNLPGYETPRNAILDMSGINSALDNANANTFKQAHLDNEANKVSLQRDVLQNTKDQQDRTWKVQQAELFGRRAMAVDQMEPGPARTAAYQSLLSQHPNSASLGDEYHDPINGPRMIAAEAGQFRDKLGEDVKRSQISQHNAAANWYNARARDVSAAPTGGPTDPTSGFGMDREGNVIRIGAPGATPQLAEPRANDAGDPAIRTGAMYLADGASLPDQAISESYRYGQAGTRASSVPGIVLTDKGATDRPATQAAQGQRGLDAMTDEDKRQKFLDYQRTQQIWSHLNGKPAPSGFAYNDDGSLRDLKDESKKAIGRDKIHALLDDVATAKDVLTKAPMYERWASAKTNGWFNPVQEQAMRSVEHAVQFLTAEVEGKRHANAQDVRMLRFFAPAPTDSSEMIGFKLDQLNRIMQGYFGAKVQSGDLFRSVLAKANDARLARSGGQTPIGQTKPPPGGSPSSSPSALRGMSNEDLLRELNK